MAVGDSRVSATQDDIALVEMFSKTREHALRQGREHLPEALFRVALWLPTLPSAAWSDVAAAARALLLETPIEDKRTWARVAFARDVARRHTGEAAVLALPDEEWGDLDQGSRLALAAHAVQSAADGELALVEPYVTYGEALAARVLEGDPAEPAALRLRGAIGRALAAVGSFERAGRVLDAAVERWMAVDVRQSSLALCELLRVHGVLRAASHLERLTALVARFASENTDEVSRAFVRLSFGRALVQMGKPGDGCSELLAAEAWEKAPPHVEQSRQRWLHHAALLEGRDGSEHLEALKKMNESDQLHLAHLDLALHHGDTFEGPVLALFDVVPTGTEAARALVRIAPTLSAESRIRDRESVRRMAWEYRY